MNNLFFPTKESFGMSENAQTVFYKRYIQKDESDNPKETFDQAFNRVASVVASIESDFEQYRKSFYELLTSFKFVPNSPTFTGAGTKLGQLAACFVLPIDDDMGKSRAGIFNTLRDAALIQQSGGGVGFNFSELRPKGDAVRGSDGIATGPIGFLKVYDKAFNEIAQGGIRRSANMAILDVNHPDIEEFIKCKQIEGNITNFNISVGITDDFMKAVVNDTDFDLINPRNKQVVKSISASKLFDEIVYYAWLNGEPGIVFLDTINKDNPTPSVFTLKSTNPCAEQSLEPYGSCTLGSINLSKFVTHNQIDWIELEKITRLSTRFLDNVVSTNKYIDSIPELRLAANNLRRIGLGIMGLADMLYKMNIRYGSDESFDLASQIMEYIRYISMDESVNLAKERGSFTLIDKSIYSKDNFEWDVPTSKIEHKLKLNRPKLDWISLKDNIKTNGIRNAVILTIAPTGTIGTVSDVEGYGCEPVFALAYKRYVLDKGNTIELDYISPLFKDTVELHHNGTSGNIFNEVSLTGSCKSVNYLHPNIKDVFTVSQDITPEEHIKMQSVLQAWIDNSISKTCNFPKTATTDDVKKAYILAWKSGCKGLTVYVTGSRDKVVLATKETQLEKNGYYNEADLACKDGVCQIG